MSSQAPFPNILQQIKPPVDLATLVTASKHRLGNVFYLSTDMCMGLAVLTSYLGSAAREPTDEDFAMLHNRIRRAKQFADVGSVFWQHSRYWREL
eukprot:5968819-Heterocapsa_arctica.AAC.1